MRVLQVHVRYRQPGGEDGVVAAEADLLRDAGHDVTAWGTSNPEGAVAAVRALALAPHNPGAARAARLAARAAAPDVAHLHNTWFALSPAVAPALADLGLPVVLTLHNYRLACMNALLLRAGRPCEDCIGTGPWAGVRHACYRGSRVQSAVAAATIALAQARGTWTRHVDVFAALSPFGAERLVRAGIPAEKVAVKPNFVADDGERDTPPSASRTVLFVGRLSEEKGLAVLLAAWRHRPPDGLELLVVGDGPLRATLEAAAPPGVTFAGRLTPEATRAAMRTARTLAFPSIWYEGQGLVPLEAFAAGTPVLASDLGSPAEVVAPLGPRWLVPPGDPAAWSQALQGLTDGAAVDAAGRTARDRYLTSYTPEIGLRNLEAVYQRALAARDRHEVPA